MNRSTAASVTAYLVLVAYLSFPLLHCLDSCFIDYAAVHGGRIAKLEEPDARLNSWILGWVRHSLFSAPSSLFDANAFHPAENTLAGSEHMLGVALQTLPFWGFSHSAVFLHQTALILSFFLIALSTFALVRWSTQSSWAAFLAGAVAMFMPWRASELGHLQLLSAQWFPLVWLFLARLLLGEGSRRDAALLSLVVAVQVLSSFYLAYLLFFSSGLLVVCLLAQQKVGRARLYRLAAALLLPLALLAATAVPYLARFPAYDFRPDLRGYYQIDPTTAWSFLAPSWAWAREGGFRTSYSIPLSLFALAFLALVLAIPVRRGGAPADRRIRMLTVSLLAVVLGAFVMMLGRQLAVGDFEVKLPGYWAEKLIPGFSQMRGPKRWGIIIGIAFPVLAGLGIALVERGVARIGSVALGRRLRPLALALLAALLALDVPPFQLPSRPAWEKFPDILLAHRALAELPPGPVLEIPWPPSRMTIARVGSRYMLASTENWKPLLNGYTAHVPGTHHFLNRIAQRLPDEAALEKLRRLTDLRWIVVHTDRLPRWRVRTWEAVEASGALVRVFSDADVRIYELPASASAGTWREALVSREPRARTLSGLSRAPLVLGAGAGRLAVESARASPWRQRAGADQRIRLKITNETDVHWPALDIQSEGLVELRYRFLREDGGVSMESTAPLDVDLPARRTTVAAALIAVPPLAGRYRLRFDLVQRLGDELRELPIPSVEYPVEVAEPAPVPQDSEP